jgi:hypothetical protein
VVWVVRDRSQGDTAFGWAQLGKIVTDHPLLSVWHTSKQRPTSVQDFSVLDRVPRTHCHILKNKAYTHTDMVSAGDRTEQE